MNVGSYIYIPIFSITSPFTQTAMFSTRKLHNWFKGSTSEQSQFEAKFAHALQTELSRLRAKDSTPRRTPTPL